MSVVRSVAAAVAALFTVYAIQVLQLMANNAAQGFADLRFDLLTAAMAAFVAVVVVIEHRARRAVVRPYAAVLTALIVLGVVIGEPAAMAYTPAPPLGSDPVSTLALGGVSVPALLIAGYGVWRGWGSTGSTETTR